MVETAPIARRRDRASPLVVRVAAPDLDFAWARGFLEVRMVPSVEMVTPEGLERVVWLDAPERRPATARPVRLTIHYQSLRQGRPAKADLLGWLAVSSTPSVPATTLRAAVVRMFDLDADVRAFLALARRDSVLAPVVAANPRGLRLLQLLDPFEALVRAILGQQVSVAAASTMTDRLVRLVGTPAPGSLSSDVVQLLRPRYAFPRPAAVAQLGRARLRTIGLTRARAASLHSAAMAVATEQLNLAQLRAATADEAARQLLALPGVGPWTAAYIRLRALGDRDAFPSADLGLVRALTALGVPVSRFSAVAERWRPWRGYATLHLWHSAGVRSRVPT